MHILTVYVPKIVITNMNILFVIIDTEPRIVHNSECVI
jgi:hypothetical protein